MKGFNKKKEDKFYQILLKSAETVNESANVLRNSLDCLDKIDEQVKKTGELEDIGDELVRTLTKELDEAFITPIDREDLYEIVKEMDNILDGINSIQHRFIMFDIKEATDEVRNQIDIFVKATEKIRDLINELNVNGCKSKNLIDKIMEISRTESEADKVVRKTVTDLFKNEKDPITIIKWKEIYQIIEDTVDNCEKVANIVEGVVIKNA
ncbi:DUF47 domain-containing protein [uncultured Clostridium sp.]|uniref:DUF47 domain-containing protein n=1 Tax=uncultured Clostridium sp. TaxID=59620 RepID=UPI0025FD6575|nr:DUF47 family protein [uncultured Clostridium sp.]